MKQFTNSGQFKKGQVAYNKGKPAPWAKNLPQQFKKGQKHSDRWYEVMKNRIPWNKGKKGEYHIWPNGKPPLLKETIEKIKQKNKGKHFSPKTEFKKGVSVSPKTQFVRGDQRITGKNNNKYKGGITPLMEKIRHLPEYYNWRKSVWQKDYYTCQECGYMGRDIEAHHIKAFSKIIEENNIKTLDEALNCKELWDINNGITLCKKCHDKYNGK